MDGYLGEIRVFAFGLIPRHFLPCDGRLMNIGQNQPLFSLLTTRFGGDGKVNFALPDLRGRAVVGATAYAGDAPYAVAKKLGVESVTLTLDKMPPHMHTVAGSQKPANFAIPTNSVFATPAQFQTNPTVNIYTADTSNLEPLHVDTIQHAGAAVPHNNMQPYAVVNYCICILGPYPRHAD